MTNEAQDQQTFADSDELRAALERMHERDRRVRSALQESWKWWLPTIGRLHHLPAAPRTPVPGAKG